MNISFKLIFETANTMSNNIMNYDEYRLIHNKNSISDLEIEKENYIKLLFVKLFNIKSSIDWLIIQTNETSLNREKIVLDKIYYLIQEAPIEILKFINYSFDLYKMELIDLQMIDKIYAMRY
jgi:hypothetical protein